MPRGVCHWGPLLALSIITILFLSGLYAMPFVCPPWESLLGVIQLFIYLTWLFLIVMNFLKAIWLGPGYVPLKWRPPDQDDEKCLQYCQVCQGFKAPRAHHCSKCSRCVMKMDHHCPWINNCVGHKNMKSFTLFLFFVPPGCIHCAVILAWCIYNQIYVVTDLRGYRYNAYRNIMPLGVYEVIILMFCFGLAIGVTIAVGLLLYYQCKGIKDNQTAIEAWIVEKSWRPRPQGEFFIYPYDLGFKENFKQVIFHWGDYQGDGIWWPILPGSTQYALTIEQLWQKELKRTRMVPFHVIKPYNGSVIACREGLMTCISTPFSDEHRMTVAKDDVILVTRWRKYWLYGEKTINHTSKVRAGLALEKGWFPRHCVIRESKYQNVRNGLHYPNKTD